MIMNWSLGLILLGVVFELRFTIAQDLVTSEAGASVTAGDILPAQTSVLSEVTGEVLGGRCAIRYRNVPNIFDWERISICYRECTPYKVFNFTTPRGLGRAYSDGSIGLLTKPILFENVHDWKVVNCTADDSFAEACGTPGGGSTRGLYSSGGAPIDPEIRPRIGTMAFPGLYTTFTLTSFKIWTPNLGGNCRERGCTVHIRGHKSDGRVVNHTQEFSLVDKRTSVILNSRSFHSLKAVDIWVTYTKISRTIGQAFVLDDISFEEHVELARPLQCSTLSSPTSTPLTGPCSPSPTATTTFTVDFDDFVFQTTTFIGPPEISRTTGVYAPTPLADQKPYKGLYWDSLISASRKDGYQPLGEYPRIENVTLPSPPNFAYVSSVRALISANTYDERFGVKSLWVLCRFTAGSNGAPCTFTFWGFRDPYDGSGLPERVSATLTIPDPGDQAADYKFTFVDLSALTNSPGAFGRLSFFVIVCKIGNDYCPYFLDSIVFTREFGEGTACRVPGAIVAAWAPSDGWVVENEPVILPEVIGGLKWGDGWVLTGQSLYPQNSVGYNASSSPPNAIYAIGPNTWVDSYTSPIPAVGLGDFESALLTFDYPEAISNPALLERILIEIDVQDSCGHSYGSTVQDFYERHVRPGSIQYLLAVPLKGISYFRIRAWIVDLELTEPRIELRFWIDDGVFRVSNEKLQGCVNCGVRGQEWCEYPGLVRVGAPE